MTVEMLPAQGPHFPDPLVTLEDAEAVVRRPVDVRKELGYVWDAIALTRRNLAGEVPLIGFCGAPWTIFAYMVEGGGSKTFQKAKIWLWDRPDSAHAVLDKVATVSAEYLIGQVRAGAQVRSLCLSTLRVG
jgi:uroporphyrinogen decarboxylase